MAHYENEISEERIISMRNEYIWWRDNHIIPPDPNLFLREHFNYGWSNRHGSIFAMQTLDWRAGWHHALAEPWDDIPITYEVLYWYLLHYEETHSRRQLAINKKISVHNTIESYTPISKALLILCYGDIKVNKYISKNYVNVAIREIPYKYSVLKRYLKGNNDYCLELNREYRHPRVNMQCRCKICGEWYLYYYDTTKHNGKYIFRHLDRTNHLIKMRKFIKGGARRLLGKNNSNILESADHIPDPIIRIITRYMGHSIHTKRLRED